MAQHEQDATLLLLEKDASRASVVMCGLNWPGRQEPATGNCAAGGLGSSGGTCTGGSSSREVGNGAASIGTDSVLHTVDWDIPPTHQACRQPSSHHAFLVAHTQPI